jgi:hypothetical protein
MNGCQPDGHETENGKSHIPDEFSMSPTGEDSILTLEPLIDAVRAAVEGAGWSLSGLQKTTSHQFEGRWEGEATRSAFLFFHLGEGLDPISIDVYLEETGRGLTGNIALVIDLLPLGGVGPAGEALRRFGALSAHEIDDRFKRPITLRFRVTDAAQDPGLAETEVRFKVRIPSPAIREGQHAVSVFVEDVTASFARMLASAELRLLMPEAE